MFDPMAKDLVCAPVLALPMTCVITRVEGLVEAYPEGSVTRSTCPSTCVTIMSMLNILVMAATRFFLPTSLPAKNDSPIFGALPSAIHLLARVGRFGGAIPGLKGITQRSQLSERFCLALVRALFVE